MNEYERYTELLEQIRHHNDLYYNEDQPEITDFEYDQLTQKAKQIEQQHPEWISKSSPTQHVNGQASTDTEKTEHRTKLLSLDDKFSIEEVTKWFNNLPRTETFSVQEKIDGLTMTLLYENGILTQAATRGDGIIGEVVTDNAYRIQNVPHVLDFSKLPKQPNAKNMLYIRTEVCMHTDEFERVNLTQKAQGKKLFANPRNCAAGTLRSLDGDIAKSRKLDAIAFTILKSEGFDDLPISFRPNISESNDLLLLHELGFNTVTAYQVDTLEQIIKAIEQIHSNQPHLNYWIDGAVIKTDNKQIQQLIGTTNKYPKHAIAYKYPPEEKEVTIKDIILQTGRTGVITPIAVFDPVQLSGTIVSKATLHNQKFVNEKQLNIGSIVTVIKSGEIIPAVIKTIKPSNETFQITTCPICGKRAIERHESTGIYMCSNKLCPAKTYRYLEFFCSRDVMDIRHCGPAVVQKLVDNNLVDAPDDLYKLTDDQIKSLPGFDESSTKRLLKSIDESKHRDIDRLLKSFSIPHVGSHIGKILANNFETMDDIAILDENSLIQFDGIGPIAARNIFEFFNGPQRQLYENLKSAGVNTRSLSIHTNQQHKLTGLTFVITGTLPNISRSETQRLIEQNGGKCSNSVSKKTNYVIAGKNAGTKLTKAQDLDIKVISFETLQNMLH